MVSNTTSAQWRTGPHHLQTRLVKEIAERLTGVVVQAAGKTVGPVVTALMQAAAVSSGNVDLAFWAGPAGTAAGSLAESGSTLVAKAILDRSDRVQQFAEEVALVAGVEFNDVPDIAEESAQARTLLAATVSSVIDAESDWKIKTLARIFAAGADDPARVDEMVYLTKALRGVEGPEARVLAVLYRAQNSAQNTLDEDDIRRRDLGVGPVVAPALQSLIEVGLVVSIRGIERTYALTSLGGFCAWQLDKISRDTTGATENVPGLT